MKISSSQKIGIFVIAIGVSLFFALNFLKGYDIFKKRSVYHTYLPEVEGLAPTSPIYIRGFKVGTIEKIKLDPVRDSFLVSFNVTNDYLIPIDTRAEVYSSNLLGGKALRLALGQSEIGARNGDTLKGKSVPDMLSVLYGYVGPLKDKLEETVDNLNSVLASVNQTLDSAARQDLHSSLKRLDGSLANIQRLSASLNGMTPDLSSSLKNINTITQDLSAPDGDLKGAIANVNKTAENLSALRLQESLDKLNAMLEKLQSPESTTGKLMGSSDLHNSVDSLLNDIDQIVKKIKANPRKYIKVSVF